MGPMIGAMVGGYKPATNTVFVGVTIDDTTFAMRIFVPKQFSEKLREAFNKGFEDEILNTYSEISLHEEGLLRECYKKDPKNYLKLYGAT